MSVRDSSRAIATHISLLTALALVAACASSPGDPARDARRFYRALDEGRFADARSMLAPDQGVRRLEQRFGSFEAWGDRLTKNGTLSRAEPVVVRRSGDRALVETLLLFNDGTRRHEHLQLLQRNGIWLIEAPQPDPGDTDGRQRPKPAR